ncbi:hypothetical protein RhiirA5_495057 [Rhizophagus irregularis]|uniref:HAT C-terminal dimerisation domain-containing protein n=1 Tax=Rhizophagus irregularis TaxID=588596 RepID=A0A2N0Q707_9GLOM|nr:hypothetical protein RhiirA5_495057 [Rhizophagus irregularis]
MIILEKKDLVRYLEVVDSSTIVATILDPRTKLALFAIGEESTNAVNAIKSHFAEYNVSPLLISLLNTNQETVSNCEYFHQLKRKWLAISDSQTERSVRRSRSSEIYEKLNRWCKISKYYTKLRLNKFPDVVKGTFSRISSIWSNGTRLFVYPSYSVLYEQAFSVASNTITCTRNKMLPETARALLYSKIIFDKKLIVRV